MKPKERIIWVAALITLGGWLVVEKNADFTQGNSALENRDAHFSTREHVSKRPPFPDDDSDRLRSGRVRSTRSLSSDDPLTRMSGFLQALSTNDPAELEELRQEYAARTTNGRLLPSEEALLEYRTGQLDGGNLLSYRRGSAEDFAQMDSLRKQLEGWASMEPAAAGEWVEALPTGKYRDQMAISYLAAAARLDPGAAVQLAASLHPSQQAAAGRETAMALAASATGDEMEAFLKAIPRSSAGQENEYLAAVFETLATESGSMSPLVIEEHLSEAYATPATLSRISHSRAKSDPLGALEWAAELESKKGNIDRGQLLTAAVGGMTLDGLNHAEEWAAAHWGDEGVEAMWSAVMRNRELLENRGDDENEYDKDD